MKSNKRYTNQTFTKRVDHEGGLHRESRGAAEPAVCEKCGAIYENRRWTAKEKARRHDRFENWQPTKTMCPACKQIEEEIFSGYLSLSGGFLKTHREEIKNLIENEAREAAEANPLSRIIQWVKKDESEMIETTTEQLAERLGHALHKAYRGGVAYHFSHENKLVRVYWHRE